MFIFFDITENLQEWQTKTYPSFITPANNGGVPYPYTKGSVVIASDGETYKSTVDGNTNDPASDPTGWDILLDAKYSMPLAFGNPFTTAQLGQGIAALDENTWVSANNGGAIYAYQFDGTDWIQIASTVIGGTIRSIVALNATDFAVLSTGNLRYYRLSGAAFNQIGVGYSYPDSGFQGEL